MDRGFRLKLSRGQETRQVRVNEKSVVDFPFLLKKLSELFGDFQPHLYHLRYLDCDEDWITISSAADLNEALAFASEKLHVHLSDKNHKEQPISQLLALFQHHFQQDHHLPPQIKTTLVTFLSQEELQHLLMTSFDPMTLTALTQLVKQVFITQTKPMEDLLFFCQTNLKMQSICHQLLKAESCVVRDFVCQILPLLTKPFRRPHFGQKCYLKQGKREEKEMKKREKRELKRERLEKVREERELNRMKREEDKKQKEYLHVNVICDGCDESPLVGTRYKSKTSCDFDLCQHCKDSGQYSQHEPFFAMTTKPSAVHVGIGCDGCNLCPIYGVRYKSANVPNFDLCEECEDSLTWNKSHGPFLKIRSPDQSPKLLMVGNNEDGVGQSVEEAQKLLSTLLVNDVHTEELRTNFEKFTQRRLSSKFVCDISVPDGSSFAPGESFQKTWRIQNSGDSPWPANCRLVPVGNKNSILCQAPEVFVGTCEIGKMVDVSVDMHAPMVAGQYTSSWRLCNDGGRTFGHRFWVEIIVEPSIMEECTPAQVVFVDLPTSQIADSISVEETIPVGQLQHSSDSESEHLVVPAAEDEVDHEVAVIVEQDPGSTCEELELTTDESVDVSPDDLVLQDESPQIVCLERRNSEDSCDYFDDVASEIIEISEGGDTVSESTENDEDVEVCREEIDNGCEASRENEIGDVVSDVVSEGNNVTEEAEDTFQYEEAAYTLNSMGFTNRSMNITLLSCYNGDISAVINHLLN